MLSVDTYGTGVLTVAVILTVFYDIGGLLKHPQLKYSQPKIQHVGRQQRGHRQPKPKSTEHRQSEHLWPKRQSLKHLWLKHQWPTQPQPKRR